MKKMTSGVVALITANDDVCSIDNQDITISHSNFSAGKNMLRRAIQVAIAGSMLASGVASAVLIDQGPADPTITFPQWYRDADGLAMGLCRSTTAYCFPLVANPAGFVGNIGDEAFYNLIEFKNTTTGSDFQYRYLGALEASYLPGPTPTRGEETVFARIRITFNFNDTNKEGTYTITHPFGVHTFQNVLATNKTNLIGGQAANFFTVDVPVMGVGGNLTASPVGPFIKWDTDLPLVAGAEEFVGDPATPHTFTGSPFGTNFIRIQGPVGSNLDGLGNDFIEESLGNVLGQKWTAPIAQPIKIDTAYKVRKSGVNGIDVWATSTPNQRLIVTGAGMPSLQLLPSGTVAGKYHGHIEYPSTQAIPAQITVTNLASNPVNSTTAALEDGVEITRSTFETLNRQVTVVAHSSDEVTMPNLVVTGIPGIPTAAGVSPALTGAMTQAQCAGIIPVVTNPVDVCFTYTLPATVEPVDQVSVISTELGIHVDELLNIVGAPQNPLNPPQAANIAAPGYSVNTVGSTALAGLVALPLDAQIIKQPTNGTVALVNGVWTFTANATATTGADNFQYVTQAADNAPVSNLATANLTLAFSPTAPTAVADQFAATYAGTVAAKTKTVTIMGNDKPASTSPLDQINPASLTIVTAPTKGNLTKLASGQITYVTKTATAISGGADFFTYKVNNFANPAQASNTVRVDVTNFSAAEAVGFTNKYTIASNKWVINGTSSWFGANLSASTATCWIGTATTPSATTLIGSSPIDATGNFTVTNVGVAPVGNNTGAMRCRTSNGGLAAGIIAAK